MVYRLLLFVLIFTIKTAYSNIIYDKNNILITEIEMSNYLNLYKNNYDPYKGALKLSLFDECSKLDITYSNTRFNDNFNTQPEEKISFTFSMDYLGFFGYEQTTDLFFKEPGSVNYGF